MLIYAKKVFLYIHVSTYLLLLHSFLQFGALVFLLPTCKIIYKCTCNNTCDIYMRLVRSATNITRVCAVYTVYTVYTLFSPFAATIYAYVPRSIEGCAFIFVYAPLLPFYVL